MTDNRSTSLPVDSDERKGIPLVTGCYNYFPAALAGVAKHSVAGNERHNKGQPLHHARGKSMDHDNCIARHLMDIQDFLKQLEPYPNPEVQQKLLDEANALAWRALAFSQSLHERFGGAPLAPGARLPSPSPAVDAAALVTGQRPATDHTGYDLLRGAAVESYGGLTRANSAPTTEKKRVGAMYRRIGDSEPREDDIG